MKILIDADACPVVELAINEAKALNIPIHLFFDTTHIFSDDYAIIHICDKGNDSVDYEVLKNTLINDIVITQDYGLACLVLSKGAVCLNQNGLVYTNDSIDTLLQTRYIGQKIRKSGGKTKGPSKRTKENDINFVNSLRLEIKKIIEKKATS